MNEPHSFRAMLLGLGGAAVGGTLGYLAFWWAARQGFYALVLPGGLLGLGAGICARRRSVPLALICALAGLVLGLFTEWTFAPFVADHSFAYFLTHLPSLRPITLLMLALGVFLSFRLALGYDRKSS